MPRVRYDEGEPSVEFEDANGERHVVARGQAEDVPSATAKQLIKQGWEEAKQSKPGAKNEEGD